MYVGYFTFEVAPEKQEDFLKVVRETIKPHWLSTGRCWDYNVYQEWDPKTGKPGNRFIKTQVMEGTPGPRERNREDQAAIDLFYSFVKNVQVSVYLKKV